MTRPSKITRFITTSPYLILPFLVIPLLVILSIRFQLRIPFVESPTLMLVNNVSFALLILLRLIRYLMNAGNSQRYNEAYGRPGRFIVQDRPLSQISELFARDGYSFSSHPAYGEKRDYGYTGSILMYAGLFILLTAGIWGNLRQFSGILVDGLGPPTALSDRRVYWVLRTGPWAGSFADLPMIQIRHQTLPNNAYPRGATEITLQPPGGGLQQVHLQPGKVFSYGEYDIYMARLVFEPFITIRDRAGTKIFSGKMKLKPLIRKLGEYGFYTSFTDGGKLDGQIYYQPEKNRLKLVMARSGVLMLDTDLTFQVDQQMLQGDYLITIDKMGQWTEIHVVRRRQMLLLMAGALIAVIGTIVRLVYPPQRVWLESDAGTCRVWLTGRKHTNLPL